MNKKDILWRIAAAVMTVTAVGMTTSTVYLWQKVAAIEQKAGQPGKPRDAATDGQDKPGQQEDDASTNSVSCADMQVETVRYDGEMQLSVFLSATPDMRVVREYVSVEPKPKGSLGMSFTPSHNRYLDKKSGRVRKCAGGLVITGDYAHRTNVTLRIRKGFPVYCAPSETNTTARALTNDYVWTFQRKDLSPSVDFADDGRYLPPIGRRALSVASLNAKTLVARISSVPSANIVQYLALEERAYKNIYSGWNDQGFVRDLSCAPRTKEIRVAVRPNEEVKTPLGVTPSEGVASNGIYLVALNGYAKDGRQIFWRDKYRVVCVSDLGISVHQSDTGLFVWVTSFTHGTPVAGARVEVYSPAQELVARGQTDATGRCVCKKLSDGEAFAVVVTSADGSDRSFMALRRSMERMTSKALPDEPYLTSGEVDAFVWTERGIYRHDEKIFLQAILRTDKGVAPKVFPVEILLVNPSGTVYQRRTVMSDERGSVSCEDLSVPADQPSGVWTLKLMTPGKEDSTVIGSRTIRIEEFALPQIRVKTTADSTTGVSNFAFVVSAEHLYGGPAKSLACAGAIVFEDAAFAPAKWKGWQFGDTARSLKPNYRQLAKTRLDTNGVCRFEAPLWEDYGRPTAAVRAIAQGTVYEDGGRPATTRETAILHFYPYYIGTTLSSWQRKPSTRRAEIEVACVKPNGERLPEARTLSVKLERIDSIYTCKIDYEHGWRTWECTRVRTTVAENLSLVTKAEGNTRFEIPTDQGGDYVLTMTDAATGVSFGRAFYLSDSSEAGVTTSLANPSVVTLDANKPFYRPGEQPRLRVRAPFAGTALVSVMRENLLYTEVISLTNATAEIVLKPLTAEQAPNVVVSVSVLQSVTASAKGLAVKAHGMLVVPVRSRESEVPVSVQAAYEKGRIRATLSAPGATHAVVTVVDEAIHLLTAEPTPNPIACLFRPRWTDLPLYDLYNRVLPVQKENTLRANGAKTGGGLGAELLDRVSPVPTRRFKPLALWQREVQIVDGRANIDMALPEFVGEVRVTAIAYSARAVGAAATACKVSPRLVVQPDAPRFVAPGDTFEVTLPLANRSGADGEVAYTIETVQTNGTAVCVADGRIRLAKDDSTVLRFPLTAPPRPGSLPIRFRTQGLTEKHETTIELPVRPAVAWQETSGLAVLAPGESWTIPKASAGTPEKFRHTISSSRMTELKSALEWLAEYPHGCLEQTCSRIFPLITAGGILNSLASDKAANRAAYVSAGVRRVESMVRQTDFVMWPDCSYAPWDREVALYAAHFLMEAARAGAAVNEEKRRQVMGFLKKWAMDKDVRISAYACHTLAVAGRPERDRMFRLYDAREKLDLLSRARLARAFVLTGDRVRAAELLKRATAPSSVREAAFALLALLESEPSDARIDILANWLTTKRDKTRFAWGTTSENAHALLALGEYWRRRPIAPGRPEVREADGRLMNVGKGTAFVHWKHLTLPPFEEGRDEAEGIRLRREFLTAEGEPYDLSRMTCGDLVIVRLTLSTDTTRTLTDLVFDVPFPAAIEPVLGGLDQQLYSWVTPDQHFWVMRSDARDDRLLVFSKKFTLEKNDEVQFHYPLRVVSAGVFALPGASVEAMYQPCLRARTRGGRLVVRH